MTRAKVTIVDYRVGNLYSLARALSGHNFDIRVSGDPAEIASADGVVLPGVGAFGAAIEAITESGLRDVIGSYAGRGMPLLAICLGMQLLGDTSEESEERATGLGIIGGHVRGIRPGPPAKIPHLGWNKVEGRAAAGSSSDFGGGWFYFAHSYVLEPSDPRWIVATTTYGADTFSAAIEKDGILAVQFHPELSAEAGHAIISRFARMVRGA